VVITCCYVLMHRAYDSYTVQAIFAPRIPPLLLLLLCSQLELIAAGVRFLHTTYLSESSYSFSQRSALKSKAVLPYIFGINAHALLPLWFERERFYSTMAVQIPDDVQSRAHHLVIDCIISPIVAPMRIVART